MSQDTSHNKYILLRQGNIRTYIFGEGKNTLKCFETERNIDRKYGITYCRKSKKKKFFGKWKVANWKLRNLGNLGNLGNIIPSFPVSKFSILPYSQNRKLGFKNLGKKFPIFLRFPSFPSFRPDPLGRAVKLNLWANAGSSESQKSVSFDSGVIW